MIDQPNLLQTYLYRLTDPQLLYLYHIHIGDVPTPFHKPKLIEELISYLRQQETLSATAGLLEADELAAVTAAALTPLPSSAQLNQILICRGLHAAAAERMLLHLEERLVLLPLQESDGTVWQVNPLLQEYIGGSLHIDALFAPGETPDGPVKELWFTPSMLPGWLSLLQHRSELFDRKGMPKRQREGELRRLYPGISDPRRFSQLSQTARKAGILKGSFHLDHEAARMLFTLDSHSLTLHFAYRLVREYGITRGQFARLLSVCRHRWYASMHLTGIIMTLSGLSRQQCDALLDCLKSFGFAAEIEGTVSLVPLHRSLQSKKAYPSSEEGHLSKDFGIHIDRNLPLHRWAHAYRFSALKLHDRMTILQVNQRSMLEALDSGMSTDEITDALRLISTDPPALLLQFIQEWAQSYETISLFSGIVLQCNERTERIITRHPTISSMIVRTIAPGVFLFSEKESEQLRIQMIEAGLPFVPAVRTAESMKHPGGTARGTVPMPPEPILLPKEVDSPTPIPRYDDEIIKGLHQSLERFSGSSEMISELRYRIDQKLILTEQQLIRCSKKRHIFEAKGFDYQGKVQLIRQALKSKADILEIQLHQDGQSMLLFPELLIRQGNADILQGRTIPENEEYRISAGKLFLVRKIRKPLLLPKRDSSIR